MLSIYFDSTRAGERNLTQGYNRSAWSDDKRLVYCEKGTRTIVEYQWDDLEKGIVDKFKKIDSGLNSDSKTADLVLERKGFLVLLKDGWLSLKNKSKKITGKWELHRRRRL